MLAFAIVVASVWSLLDYMAISSNEISEVNHGVESEQCCKASH